MPDVIRRSVHAMRMQVGELRVVAVALESLLRAPLDQDQHLARLDLARHRFAEAAQRDDAAAMRLHLACRALGIREVFLLARDVEEIERVDLQCQISLAASTQSLSFARWSASVRGLPPMVLAKPHWGLMASRSSPR